MASVQANAKPVGAAHALDDFGQVLKAMAKTFSLTRGGLQQNLHSIARAAAVDFVKGLCHPRQPGLFIAVHRHARMRHEVVEAQHFRPLHFDDKRLQRAPPKGWVMGCQIDEIRIMGNDDLNARFVSILPKKANVLVRQRLGSPLIVVFGEDLHGTTIMRFCGQQGLEVTPRDRHMGTEQRHALLPGNPGDSEYLIPRLGAGVKPRDVALRIPRIACIDDAPSVF